MIKSEQYDTFCRFIRALKANHTIFTQNCLQTLYLLEKSYKQSTSQIQELLKKRHEKHRQTFEQLYELTKKISEEQSCEQQLFHHAQFSSKHQCIMSWFKQNRQKGICEYIEGKKTKAVVDYQEQLNQVLQLAKQLDDRIYLQAIANPIDCGTHKKISKSQQTSKNITNQITVEQILQLPKTVLEKLLTQVNKTSSLKQQLGKDAPKRLKKTRDKELEKAIGQRFCSMAHEIKFQYLPKPLRQKLKNGKQYQLIVKSSLNCTVKNIEMLVEKEFGFRRMTHHERASIITDLKNYGLWMSKQEGELFIKAHRLFNGLDKDIQISAYQIYVLYVIIVNKYLENLINKCKRMGTKPIITQNQSPKNIRKEITYLYYYYDNLQKVTQLLLNKYFVDTSITCSFLQQQFRSLFVETYQRICRQQQIENKHFVKIMMQKKQYNQQPWITIATNYIEYQIHNKLSDKAKDYLKKIMEIIVSQHEPKIKAAGSQLNGVKSQSEASSKQDKKSIIMNFKLQNKQQKEKIIRETRVIKIEEDSSQQAESVDS